MSLFFRKIRDGQLPTDADWVGYLIDAHRIAPSMTPEAFGAHRTREGKTSYEVLADTLSVVAAPNLAVLDLACGDGHLARYVLPKVGAGGQLFGIDMSETELAVAKRNNADPRARFFCAKAQELPLPSASIDVALSHMAFMLMLPVEPVVAELARVLKSGGRFSAIVGSVGMSRGLFGEIQKLAFGFIDSRYPKFKEARSGDRRVYSEEGLSALFTSELGFSGPVENFEFELQFKTDVQGVWGMMKDMYFVSMLPPPERNQLHDELVAFVRTCASSSGAVAFEFPMRKFTVLKR